MKKIFIFILLIVLLLLAIIGANIYNNNAKKNETIRNNKTYESFYNVDVLGTDLASLINKIEDSNERNNVEKDENGKYIDNNKNSIKLEVKFLESDEIIQLETIEKLGIKQFVQNFGAMTFKCTKKEYHQKTNYIKYMFFEQMN